MNTPTIITRLVNSHATLVMAYDAGMGGGKPIEEVPESYTYREVTYPLRQMVEVEVARRTIEAIG